MGPKSKSRRRALTLVETLVVLGIILLLLAIVFPAIQRVRGAADGVDCGQRLRQLGLAFHQYQNAHGRLPPGCSYDGGKDPFPHMSWCTRLLPFLDREALWQESIKAFEQDQFFRNNPPHVGMGTIMPPFLCPADNRKAHQFSFMKAAFTSYQGVVGINQSLCDGMLYLDSKTSLNTIPDGAEYTLLVGERPPSASGRLGWWYGGWGQNQTGNADLVLGVNELNTTRPQLPPGPYEFGPGNTRDEQHAFRFWSLHSGGAHFLMAGGSVHFFRYSAKSILPALATRAGHEPAELPE